MSQLVIPDVGKVPLLKIQMGVEAVPVLHCRLYTNNHVPSNASVLANLTEANFSGYAVLGLAGTAVAAALDATRRAVVSWNPITWTKAGVIGNNIAGYYVLRSDDQRLLWLELFDNVVSLQADGSSLTFTPRFTLMSQFLN